MNSRLLVVLALLACGGCGAIPKDPDGTLERVRSEHLFTVGLIAPRGETRIDAAEAAFLRGVAVEAKARPRLIRGSAESLFLDLEEGELDLVLGQVAPASPWMTRLTFLRPIEEHVGPERHLLVTPIAKNGENAWIMLLEKVDTQVAARSRS